MNTELTSNKTAQFETMASVARKLIQQNRRDRFTSDQELAAEAGVSVNIVKTLLSEKEPFNMLTDMQGKDWERLITAARIYPEDWVNLAAEMEAGGDVKGEKASKSVVGPPPKSNFLVAAGKSPSTEMDAKIMAISSSTNAFYLEASTRYINTHGATTDHGKNPGNHKQGSGFDS